MSGFLDSLPSRIQALEESVTDDLTMMVQNHARGSGWPVDAWRSLNVVYQPKPDDTGFYGYKIAYWRAEGDIDVVRSEEYGFNGREPNPACRRMATRLKDTAKFLLAQKLRG